METSVSSKSKAVSPTDDRRLLIERLSAWDPTALLARLRRVTVSSATFWIILRLSTFRRSSICSEDDRLQRSQHGKRPELVMMITLPLACLEEQV